jgi:hypothetical protein
MSARVLRGVRRRALPLALLLVAGVAAADGAPPLLVLTDFDTVEFGADGGAQVLASRSRAADERLALAVRVVLEERGLATRPMPTLEAADEPALSEHVHLAALAVRSRAALERPPRLLRAEGFEWSVGSGLASLRERTGAESLVLVSGYRFRSSTNRIVSQTLLSVASIALTPVWLLPAAGSDASAVVALIDLASGEIRWSHEVRDSGADPERDGEALDLVRRLLKDFPTARLTSAGSR